MKLIQLIKENEEPRPLSPQVKKHFLEIISTYNKYQEMMDRKSDLTEVAETLGGITEAAKTLLLGESDDWFDKVTIKRNLNELDKLGKEFDKCATEANSLDQRLNGLYEDMGHILSRYYKMGEITEDQMKQRLGIRESVKPKLKEVKDLTESEMKLYQLGEKVEKLMEKNCPTDPEKWSASKSAAKAKFDVYPSAYANGWAAKNYKGKGGGWKKCKD